MRLNREKFLLQLETLQPGLSAREIVEQSSCFVFQNKMAMTYNDEIACRCPTDLPIEGAVRAGPLLEILRKMAEEEIEVSVSNGELLIKGKKRRAGIRTEKDVLLQIDNVEKPGKWKALPEDFSDALFIVQQCAGSDQSLFFTVCVHIHTKWIEASDNYQISRYKIKTGVDRPCLVRSDSIRHVVELGMVEFSETENWIHFRNRAGLILSCRRFLEEYPDMTPLLKTQKGTPASLPKGLVDAVDKAQVFSSEDKDNNHVKVELRPGKLRIRGEGASGWYSEVKNLNYSGEPMSFLIAPKLLAEFAKKYHECEISPDKLRVDGGKFVYITVLELEDKSPDSEESQEQEGDQDEET